jgi:drug/metabolite transporter (DMT)-like permease
MQRLGLGVAFLLGFVATQAIRDVYLGHLFGGLGLFEVALLAFGTAAGVFGVALLLFRRHQIDLLVKYWRVVIALNVTTALAWMSYFGALRLVEPAAANLAFSGIAPISVAALSAIGFSSGGERVPSRAERGLHWALFATVVSLGLIVSVGLSGLPRLDPVTGLAGVVLATTAGFVITVESIYAKRMNVAGIMPLTIVGVRFLLVTCISGVMVSQSPTPFEGLSGGTVASYALVFLGILIGPVYLAQAGLSLTSPLVSSVILSIGPVVTLILQSTAGGLSVAPAMLAVTVGYAISSVVAARLATRTDANAARKRLSPQALP